ncbi:MAG TPA: hypothetical protein DHN33_09515, partial [Eubacteriaceae bacterium]|nr:hypothetical protein [Eubacteriaceae bacterium]
MKNLAALFLKDIRLSTKGLYFYIEIGMAVIFVLVLLFLVPENFESSRSLHLYFENGDESLSDVFDQDVFDDSQINMVESRSGLQNHLEEDRSSVGAVLSRSNQTLNFEMILQGYESDSLIRLLELGLLAEFHESSTNESYDVETIVLEPNAAHLSDRDAIIPVYLTMNIGLMGLFIIAAYIFLDKDEGIIKAHQVTPVRLSSYLLSKMMLLLLTGLITSFLVVLALAGTQLNYLMFFIAVFAFNLFGSALGLFVSSFFDTMVKAMGALYGIIMIMVLPILSYFMPSFSPFWIRVFPTY